MKFVTKTGTEIGSTYEHIQLKMKYVIIKN